MNRKLLSVLLAAASMAELPPFPPATAYAAPPPRPSGNIAYLRANGAWQGYWPHGAEYAEYTLGEKAQLNDGFHVLLRPGLELMLTFADVRRFGASPNLLEAHKQWELAWWRKQAGRVEASDRSELAGGRSDVKITELDLVRDGKPVNAYLIAAAARDGVFVFAISPATAADDALVRRIADSIRVVRHPLDIEAEAERAKTRLSPAPVLH